MKTYHPGKTPLRLWDSEMDHCLEERTHRDTEEKQPCEDRGKDWSDVATAKKCQEPLEAGEGEEGSPPGASREATALLAAWFWTISFQH